jgi:hypothetical protein
LPVPALRQARRRAAPTGLEPGSPVGRSIVTLAINLRFAHAIGYQRLAALFSHLFNLAISGRRSPIC